MNLDVVLTVCSLCHKENGLAIDTKLRVKPKFNFGDRVVSGLCEDCEKKLKTHVGLIVVKSEEKPERTGELLFVHPEVFGNKYPAGEIMLVTEKHAEELKTMLKDFLITEDKREEE